MADLVRHVAIVYNHKTHGMRHGELADQQLTEQGDPIAQLRTALGDLLAEFAARRPDQNTPTWFETDQTVGFWMRRKISLLRRGVSALTRAFAHTSQAADEGVLRDAARSSPLVHWAMRYARAIFLVDAGRQREARLLLADAPVWPEDSAFRSFHEELVAQLP